MRILLATGIESLDTKLKNELVSEGHEVKEAYYREADMEGFDLVVLSPSLPGEKDPVDMIYSLREEDTRVVLLAGSMSESELKKVISLGVYDILFDPIKHTDVMDVIKNPRKFKEVSYLISKTDGEGSGQEAEGELPAERVIVKAVKTVIRQQILTWWSASGGEGKTTLAVAQAYMLAQETKEKVALLDFNEVTSHCSWYLGVESYDPAPIYDAIEKNELGINILEDNMVKCPKLPNLKIFTGIPLRRYENFKIEHYSAIIDTLATFPYIVIDINPGIFYASCYASLKKATAVNVVAEPLYRSIYDTKNMIDFVEKTWKIPREVFRVYINKMCFEGIDLDTIKAGLRDIKVAGVIRYNQKVISALNSGKPYTKGFESLLNDLGISSSKRSFLVFFKRKRGEPVGAN